MHVCKYLTQRVRRIGEQNGKSFKRVSKKKNGKKNTKKLSFITEFKIEFLLPFTNFRKVLGKMPENIFAHSMSQINWYSETSSIFPFMVMFRQNPCPGNTNTSLVDCV